LLLNFEVSEAQECVAGNSMLPVFLCAFGLYFFAPWREKQFSQRRKVKTEGAKKSRR
jgi:hypothetical protein